MASAFTRMGGVSTSAALETLRVRDGRARLCLFLSYVDVYGYPVSFLRSGWVAFIVRSCSVSCIRRSITET